MKKIGLVLMATATLALSGCAELSNLYEETLESGKIRPVLEGGPYYTTESTYFACEDQNMWGKVSECRSARRYGYCIKQPQNPYTGFCVNPSRHFENPKW